jgi:uncharacterized protein YjiS (DUF1127 family)
MSTQFRTPQNFVRRDDIRFSSGHAVEDVGPTTAPLRESHIVLYAVDAFVRLHASFKKWGNRRLTLRALSDLDENQLRDIGLARDETGYRPLEGLGDAVERKNDIGA